MSCLRWSGRGDLNARPPAPKARKAHTCSFVFNEAFDRPCSPAPLRRETHETFFSDQILAPSFLNHFNHFRVSRPVSSVLACYTRIMRRQCLIPSLPSSRETHLAQKPLPLRLPTSTNLRNPLKKSGLQ